MVVVVAVLFYDVDFGLHTVAVVALDGEADDGGGTMDGIGCCVALSLLLLVLFMVPLLPLRLLLPLGGDIVQD